MAAPLCRLLSALAAVQANGGAPDELSLVQQGLHVSEPDADLRPSAMPAEFLAVQQFRLLGHPMSINTDDLMTLVMEVLADFRDEKLLQTVYAGVENFTKVTNETLTAVAENAGELSLAALESGDETHARIHLEEFLLLFDGHMETAVSESLTILQTMTAALPASSLVRQWAVAALNRSGLTNATKERVEHLVARVLIPQTRSLTEPKAGFCQRFRPLMANLSLLEKRLSTRVIPGLAEISSLVPNVVKLSKRFAPDVEEELGTFVNTTIAKLTILLHSGQIVLDKVVNSINLIVERHIECAAQTGGALQNPGSGLLAVAAATAAWIAAAL